MKRNSIYVILAVTVALTQASCQKEEMVNRLGMSDDTIKYAVSMWEFSQTRGTVGSASSTVMLTGVGDSLSIPMEWTVTDGIGISPAPDGTKGTLVNTTGDDYKALPEFASLIGNTFVAKAFDGEGAEKVSQTVTWSTTSSAWVGAPEAKWPKGTSLDFLAYANLPGSQTATITKDGVSTTHTVPAAASDQKDILLGSYRGYGFGMGIAEIRFEHPLTAVRFQYGEIEDNPSIRSISLDGVAGTGTATMDADGTISWSEVGTRDYSVSQTSETSLNVDESTNVIGEPFIIIPQLLTDNNVTVKVTFTNDLEVEAIIDAGEWKAGCTNTYTLGYSASDPHEYVDLGLSVLWATCNIGAAEPEEYGKYFAWGDVEGRTPATDGEDAFAAKPFSWKNTPFNNGEEDIDANYFNAHKSEWITGVNTLKPEYDAASVNWGGGWRMPTKAEFDELIAKTDYEYTSDFEGTGVCGYVFTSKKDASKSIFLPIANFGEGNILVSTSDGAYWSSSLNTINYYPQRAFYLHLLDIVVSSTSNNGRYYGYSVRPVKEKPLPEGALRGLFSVSATEQVHFSKGNLYCIDKGSGTSPRYEFNFESKQYDFRLRNAAGNSSMKDGNSYTVPANESGMFQWNKGNAVNGSDYGAFTTGSPTGDASDHVDWGNAMSNGDKWHTLNSDQWNYLVQRKSSTGKPLVSWALVGEIEGLVLAPDYYSGFDSNHFEWTLSQWQSYESDGFVFLPACGFLSLSQTSMHQSINDAFYMTSDAYDSGHAYIICAVYSADSEFQPAVGNASRNAAHPVRLVTYAD